MKRNLYKIFFKILIIFSLLFIIFPDYNFTLSQSVKIIKHSYYKSPDKNNNLDYIIKNKDVFQNLLNAKNDYKLLPYFLNYNSFLFNISLFFYIITDIFGIIKSIEKTHSLFSRPPPFFNS